MEIVNPLSKMIAAFEQQKDIKKDVVLSGTGLTYNDGKLWVADPGVKHLIGYNPTETCHSQVAEKLGIPMPYYRRMMADYPELLESNINGWLQKNERIKYLLRTFSGGEDHGIARALLSNSFNIIDNYDVLLAALEAIKGMGMKVGEDIVITKAEVTDKRMYLHVVCPKIEQDATAFLKDYMRGNEALGNGILSGLGISNSEVGLGSFEIRPRAVIVKCNNGLVSPDDRFRKIHLGARMDEGEIVWSEETKQINLKLIMSQCRDAIKTFLSQDYLGKVVEKIAEAHNVALSHPVDTMQHVCKELSINEDHKREILRYFMEDGDARASGLFHGITKQAQNMDADSQYEVEAGAFQILPKITKYDKPFRLGKN